MSQPIRVVIADDHAHARDGLRALLATLPQIEIVGEAVNGQDAIRIVAERQPDVVLMDVQMPMLDGLQATQHIKRQWPATVIIVLTLYATERAAALASGADTFIIKGDDPGQLVAALLVQRVGNDPETNGDYTWHDKRA